MFDCDTQVKRTNLKMLSSVKIVDDRSEPTILMALNDGRDLEVLLLLVVLVLVLVLFDS